MRNPTEMNCIISLWAIGWLHVNVSRVQWLRSCCMWYRLANQAKRQFGYYGHVCCHPCVFCIQCLVATVHTSSPSFANQHTTEMHKTTKSRNEHEHTQNKHFAHGQVWNISMIERHQVAPYRRDIHAPTSRKIYDNLWTSMKITRNRWKK